MTPCSSVSIINFEPVNAGWERLSFCNSVRLYEKAQDNITGRVAADKKPLTLDKDKEDQNIISAIQSRLFYIWGGKITTLLLSSRQRYHSLES